MKSSSQQQQQQPEEASERQAEPTFAIPAYTSPPLPAAIDTTPPEFRSDDVISMMRETDAAGNCTTADHKCQIVFSPSSEEFTTPSKVGVTLYGAALVDPRAYSVLAERIVSKYGIPVVIPVFTNDLSFVFGKCNSGRMALAEGAFPDVEKWILAGHSWGGTAASADLWSEVTAVESGAIESTKAAGLVMMGSRISDEVGCGSINFRHTPKNSSLPMASITGSKDLTLNRTAYDDATVLLSNNTQFLDIVGGNHDQFAAYDGSERGTILPYVDGPASIPADMQWDHTVLTIAQVASQVGVPLPKRRSETKVLTPTQQPNVGCSSTMPAAQITTATPTLASSFGGVGNQLAASHPHLPLLSLLCLWILHKFQLLSH